MNKTELIKYVSERHVPAGSSPSKLLAASREAVEHGFAHWLPYRDEEHDRNEDLIEALIKRRDAIAFPQVTKTIDQNALLWPENIGKKLALVNLKGDVIPV